MCKLSIPTRLKWELLHKEAFDVPQSRAGTQFMSWWDTAKADSRDQVMKLAYAEDLPVTEALAKIAHAPYENDE